MKFIFLLNLFLLSSIASIAQLDSLVDSQPDIVSEKVTGAFKSTRVVNSHSIEMLSKKNLDVRILHRFGFVNDGIDQLFGIDEASMRMGFDYGISSNLTLGIGRSTFRKELDGFLKYRPVQQSENGSPLSIVAIQGITTWTEKTFTEKVSVEDRTAYYTQLLAGSKVSEKFSLQAGVTFLHRNMAQETGYRKNNFSAEIGSRIKISKRTALTFDYNHNLKKLPTGFYNPLSLGFDIETGGHVFQLHFSNATGMNERAFLTETTGKFFEGDIRFGFNLSRMFTMGK